MRAQSPELLEGSLLQNLLYGVLPAAAVVGGEIDADAAPNVPPLQTLWRLCRHVGLSAAVIGAAYDPQWGALRMGGARSWLMAEDQAKVALVRALLHCPDALLLFRVGDLWDLPEQRRLAALLRSFVDGSLDKLTRPAGRARSRFGRTVLWSTLDPVLAAALDAKDDLVLTLETSRRASLRTAADAFGGALDAPAAREWQRLWESEVVRRSWDEPPGPGGAAPPAALSEVELLWRDHKAARAKPRPSAGGADPSLEVAAAVAANSIAAAVRLVSAPSPPAAPPPAAAVPAGGSRGNPRLSARIEMTAAV